MRIFIVLREKLPKLARDSSRLLGESHSRSNKLQTSLPEDEKERNGEIKRILGEFDFLLIYGLFESSFRRIRFLPTSTKLVLKLIRSIFKIQFLYRSFFSSINEKCKITKFHSNNHLCTKIFITTILTVIYIASLVHLFLSSNTHTSRNIHN